MNDSSTSVLIKITGLVFYECQFNIYIDKDHRVGVL